MKEARKSLVGESSCGGWLGNGGAGRSDVGDDTLVGSAPASGLVDDLRECMLSTSQRLYLFVPCLGDVGS